MSTQYQTGAAIERKLKKNFEEDGFFVIRSAGSKGLFDLIAIGNFRIRLIQVKGYAKGNKPIITSLPEYLKIRNLVVPENVSKEILLYERKTGQIEVHEILKRKRSV